MFFRNNRDRVINNQKNPLIINPIIQSITFAASLI